MRIAWRLGLFAVLAIIVGACGSSPSPTAPPADRVSDPTAARSEVQLPGAGVNLGGVLLRPNASGLRPAIVVLHGWQESGVNGAARIEPVAAHFASLGYVALGLSMRGWPPSGGVDDCGLRQPDDIAAAFNWLVAQPGVDQTRLAVLGFSQGGQVALLTGTRSTTLSAIVAYGPVTLVERWKQTVAPEFVPSIPNYITAVCEPGGVNQRSPVTQAARISAPVLLVHGDADTRVPTEQSLLMRDALQQGSGQVQLFLLAGAAHNLTAEQFQTSLPIVERFLAETLGLQ